MSIAKDISGQRFGKWTVVSRAAKSTRTNSMPARWNVTCDCGTVSTIPGSELRKKSHPSRSCGCSNRGPQPHKVGKYSRSKHHAWKGGRSVDKKGYCLISISMIRDVYPDARFREGEHTHKMFEHRAAMSHHLKRPLSLNETVHHRNGNRSDNRIDNLELRAGKHGPGQTPKDLVKWAREILKRYA